MLAPRHPSDVANTHKRILSCMHVQDALIPLVLADPPSSATELLGAAQAKKAEADMSDA